MTADLTCQELVELLSDYLDNELSTDVVEHIASHLSDCPACQTALDHLRSTIAVTRSVEVAALAPAVRHRLLQEFRSITG